MCCLRSRKSAIQISDVSNLEFSDELRVVELALAVPFDHVQLQVGLNKDGTPHIEVTDSLMSFIPSLAFLSLDETVPAEIDARPTLVNNAIHKTRNGERVPLRPPTYPTANKTLKKIFKTYMQNLNKAFKDVVMKSMESAKEGHGNDAEYMLWAASSQLDRFIVTHTLTHSEASQVVDSRDKRRDRDYMMSDIRRKMVDMLAPCIRQFFPFRENESPEYRSRVVHLFRMYSYFLQKALTGPFGQFNETPIQVELDFKGSLTPEQERNKLLRLVVLCGRILDKLPEQYQGDIEFILAAGETSVRWATSALAVMKERLQMIDKGVADEDNEAERGRVLQWNMGPLNIVLQRMKNYIPDLLFEPREKPSDVKLTPFMLQSLNELEVIETAIVVYAKIYPDNPEIQEEYRLIQKQLYSEGSPLWRKEMRVHKMSQWNEGEI